VQAHHPPAEGPRRAERPCGGRYAGHAIITAFGHEQRSVATFSSLNDQYYEGAWRQGHHILMPIILFVGNVAYVLVAVIGGVLATCRSLAIGDVQAFIHTASSRCRSRS
jgi:ATP-binding cassette subfamily B protein